jgi:uncharacterized protein
VITDLSALPLAAIVALNNDHAVELSFADAAQMQQLIAMAYFACGTADASAFLISFDSNAAYTSENFLWFKTRYARFTYIDRVVVSPQARGRGLARHLYEALFAKARADGFTQIMCEVNSDPPNPGSDAFHTALGFAEVGAQTLSARSKSVRYMLKAI